MYSKSVELTQNRDSYFSLHRLDLWTNSYGDISNLRLSAACFYYIQTDIWKCTKEEEKTIFHLHVYFAYIYIFSICLVIFQIIICNFTIKTNTFFLWCSIIIIKCLTNCCGQWSYCITSILWWYETVHVISFHALMQGCPKPLPVWCTQRIAITCGSLFGTHEWINLPN